MKCVEPRGRRVLEAVILAMAGVVASMGVTLGCLIRNLIQYPEAYAHNWSRPDPASASALHGNLGGTGVSDMVLATVLAVLMLLWIWAFVLFVRREPRSPLTWATVAVVGGAFLWLCWQNWRMAYPVCNAM